MQPTAEHHDVDAGAFAAIRAAGRPAVLRGLVADWPAVVAAREGRLRDYLGAMATEEAIPMVRAAPEEDGLLHYEAALKGPNFTRTAVTMRGFLAALAAEAGKPRPDTLAVQGLDTRAVLPGFGEAHRLALLPPDVSPRVWIGTAAKVATHNDPAENIACVVAGRRRFTLFAPDQIGNLYMGPFHVTPAGTPVSMVHVTRPDLERFPRFAEALAAAESAELGPGDAIYIPYGWYHHVEALAGINMLANFWWNPARRDLGSPWDALMHGMMSMRQLPPDQRRAWRAMFDHYVFLAQGDPAAHLPPAARGILDANTPEDVAQLRRTLIAALQRGPAG
ncbi:cupin-like domain-containing protein [Sphingomonas sp. KR1UV-12]|uniref:Cupin-like domain-containing protein n=1 Tax=Sphingomonas aurea TaxID=3063994 RepID=A0ABT9EJ90_9SPHN|nr:cupin-like domain-containing protein [Sphingomonas sp. KR1UV-12]MDP1026708.1 cupin-like domain-containing protein [Sphingomonas sp. KR1UV-12]